MKKQIGFFDTWINTFILSKKPLTIIQKIFFLVSCIIILIGCANVFGKFLSLANTITILVIFFSFSAYIDYKLFIFPLQKYKEKNKKRLLSNRFFGICSYYTILGLISWFSLSYFSHRTVLLLLLYYVGSFSTWVNTKKEAKELDKYFISIYGKDIVESSWNDDFKEVKKRKKHQQKTKIIMDKIS